MLLVAGCSSGTDYSAQTAESLQSRVLGIATLANSRDYAGALRQLAQLEQADNAALSSGSITRARHDAILATVALVRSDLTALQAAAKPVGTAPPPPAKHPRKHGGDGQGNGNGNGDGGD